MKDAILDLLDISDEARDLDKYNDYGYMLNQVDLACDFGRYEPAINLYSILIRASNITLSTPMSNVGKTPNRKSEHKKGTTSIDNSGFIKQINKLNTQSNNTCDYVCDMFSSKSNDSIKLIQDTSDTVNKIATYVRSPENFIKTCLSKIKNISKLIKIKYDAHDNEQSIKYGLKHNSIKTNDIISVCKLDKTKSFSQKRGGGAFDYLKYPFYYDDVKSMAIHDDILSNNYYDMHQILGNINPGDLKRYCNTNNIVKYGILSLLTHYPLTISGNGVDSTVMCTNHVSNNCSCEHTDILTISHVIMKHINGFDSIFQYRQDQFRNLQSTAYNNIVISCCGAINVLKYI